jgi:hypothetical protein
MFAFYKSMLWATHVISTYSHDTVYRNRGDLKPFAEIVVTGAMTWPARLALVPIRLFVIERIAMTAATRLLNTMKTMQQTSERTRHVESRPRKVKKGNDHHRPRRRTAATTVTLWSRPRNVAVSPRVSY